MELTTNTIHCGDNLEELSKLPDNSIDLIYADPPFFSNKHYEIIWNDGAELRAFEDRWQGGINNYVKWMRQRLFECHRVLKDTGSMYLHCDWHANAHLRIQMDNIFGVNNYADEIIWSYSKVGGTTKKLLKWHETIYRYTKNYKQSIFNVDAIRIPYSKATLKGATKGEDGKLYYHRGLGKDASVKRLKSTPINPAGRLLGDVWHMGDYAAPKGERIGYPTQKPEALLKRIIEASSNKGNIVLDPFCGCGTTISVAHQLGRKWIGIDVSPTACRMMGRRLSKIGAEVNIVNMPETIEHLKALAPFNFQGWVVDKINGTHNNKKSGDMGIDGWTILKHEPIQVKQSENVGRNFIDNFETAIRRASHTYGEIYAFSFAKGAYEEAARAELKDGITIKLINISELLTDSEMKPIEKQRILV